MNKYDISHFLFEVFEYTSEELHNLIQVPYELKVFHIDLKKRFKLKAFEYHPDRGGDEEKLKRLTEAYTCLKKIQMVEMQLQQPVSPSIVIRWKNVMSRTVTSTTTDDYNPLQWFDDKEW